MNTLCKAFLSTCDVNMTSLSHIYLKNNRLQRVWRGLEQSLIDNTDDQ